MLQRPERKGKSRIKPAPKRSRARIRNPGGGSKPRLGAVRARTIAVRLPDETLERIREIAERLDITESQTIRSLIAIGLGNTFDLDILCDSDAGNIVTPPESETASTP